VRSERPSRAIHDAMSIRTPSNDSTPIGSRLQPLPHFKRYGPSPVAALAGLPSEARAIHERRMVGLSRFELLTPRLSSVCSNQLSYRPRTSKNSQPIVRVLSKLDSACLRPVANPESQIDLRMFQSRSPNGSRSGSHSRKEVIQPQVLLQLPCYDFTPITDHTLGASLPCGLVRRLLVQPAFVM
jgi:hypothetical protein